ncbi:MAG TPA: TonB-dependent receptor [Polyangiaceae bacterium]|nr:TonB-dependent receptor [Polyangiaceae bacterium]
MALSLLSTTPAWAQTIGVATLSGKVVDTQSKAPIADAVVTVTSPALQGEQTVVTDGSGFYRIPNLPPGDYTLRVEADRYRVYARGGIALRANVTVRLDVEVLPETLTAEEVTVVGRPPTVDVGSTSSGLNMNSDFIERLPLAPPGGKGGLTRSFEQLAEAVPTGRSDAYGASLAGTTSPENAYIVDGLSVSDPGVGLVGTPVSLEFIKEVNVVTGGYLPEYGRTQGGVLDVVTKSGSNEFHGSIWGNWTPGQANPKRIVSQDTITTQRKLLSTQDIGFSLGGPLIKDKLWFFVGGQAASAYYQAERELNAFLTNPDGTQTLDAEGLAVSAPISGSKRQFRAKSTQYQLFGKLDFRVDQNNTVSFSVKSVLGQTGGNGYFALDPQSGLIEANQTFNVTGRPLTLSSRKPSQVYDFVLKWSNSSMNKRLLFDTTLGYHTESTTGSGGLAADGSEIGTSEGISGQPLVQYRRSNPSRRSIAEFETIPGTNPETGIGPCTPDIATNANGQPLVTRCPIATYNTNGPGGLQKSISQRIQLREVVTFLFEGLGHHVVKVGGEVEYSAVDNTSAFSGGFNIRESGGGGAWESNRGYFVHTGPDQLVLYPKLNYKVNQWAVGGFAQDSWSIMDRVTLNAGIRYDTQTLYGSQGDVALSLPNQISPRLGLIWDPTQSGRAKIYANYALYYQSIPLRLAYRSGSGEPGVFYRLPKAACPDPNASDFRECNLDPNNVGRSPLNTPDDPNIKYTILGFGRTFVDKDLKPGSSTEISGGGEYEVIPQGRVGATYLRRQTNNVIEDMSRDEAATYFIGNPGQGIAKDFPKAERVYDAGIFTFTKAFADDWLAQVSYTLAYLRGNWEGFFRSQTLQLDPGINSDFDLSSLVVNRKGPLAGDTRHEIKVFGSKDWVLSQGLRLTTGASYRTRSGGPTNYLGSHPVYGGGEVFILPRGEGERLPWVHNFDVHMALGVYRSRTQSIALTADFFNLFNFQATTNRSQIYTTADVNPIQGSAANNPYLPGREKKEIDPARVTTPDGSTFEAGQRNPNFGNATGFQDPLTVRVGIRTTF